jgi:hypothetical protein
MPGSGRDVRAIQSSAAMQDYRYHKSEKITRQQQRLSMISHGMDAALKKQEGILSDIKKWLEERFDNSLDHQTMQALVAWLYGRLHRLRGSIPLGVSGGGFSCHCPDYGERNSGVGRGPPATHTALVSEILCCPNPQVLSLEETLRERLAQQPAEKELCEGSFLKEGTTRRCFMSEVGSAGLGLGYMAARAQAGPIIAGIATAASALLGNVNEAMAIYSPIGQYVTTLGIMLFAFQEYHGLDLINKKLTLSGTTGARGPPAKAILENDNLITLHGSTGYMEVPMTFEPYTEGEEKGIYLSDSTRARGPPGRIKITKKGLEAIGTTGFMEVPMTCKPYTVGEEKGISLNDW